MINHSDYIEYRNKVCDFLERMPIGSRYAVANICKAETKDLFIRAVKEYMDATRLSYCNGVEFSDDYAHIRKTDISYLPKLC